MQMHFAVQPLRSGRLRRAGAERGAALVEFALSLPLILLFLAGIYDLGRVQSQMNTVSQIAYQVAVIGATNPRITGDITMEQQGAKILSLVDRETSYFNATPTLAPPPEGFTTRYFQESGRWFVTATVRGNLNSYFRWIFPPLFSISVSVTAPYLYSSAGGQDSDIDGYQNGTLSDCDGTLGAAAEGDCRERICGCPEGSGPTVCAGSNTPRVCYERVVLPES